MIITAFWLFFNIHLTGKRTPAAATKLQCFGTTHGTIKYFGTTHGIIYNFNSISNKSRLELNVRQNGTIHEIQETHHVFFKKKKKTYPVVSKSISLVVTKQSH